MTSLRVQGGTSAWCQVCTRAAFADAWGVKSVHHVLAIITNMFPKALVCDLADGGYDAVIFAALAIMTM